MKRYTILVAGMHNTVRVLLVCCAVLLPLCAHAATATIRIEPISTGINSTVRADVFFDPEGELINVLEGTIQFPEGVHVGDVSSAGSAFTLWPVLPHVELGRRTIEFVGGVPNGLDPHKKVHVFSFEIRPTREGTFAIAQQQFSAFRHDGTGTRVSVSGDGATLSVSGTSTAPHPSSTSRMADDTTAPEHVYVDIGSDPSLFDGKYFLTVSAYDEQSGPVQLSVREGIFARYKPVETYYILSDQTLRTTVYVRAVDQQGNTKRIVIPGRNAGSAPWFWYVIAMALVGACVVYALYMRARRRL